MKVPLPQQLLALALQHCNHRCLGMSIGNQQQRTGASLARVEDARCRGERVIRTGEITKACGARFCRLLDQCSAKLSGHDSRHVRDDSVATCLAAVPAPK
jgi:hypothetical protein